MSAVRTLNFSWYRDRAQPPRAYHARVAVTALLPKSLIIRTFFATTTLQGGYPELLDFGCCFLVKHYLLVPTYNLFQRFPYQVYVLSNAAMNTVCQQLHQLGL